SRQSSNFAASVASGRCRAPRWLWSTGWAATSPAPRPRSWPGCDRRVRTPSAAPDHPRAGRDTVLGGGAASRVAPTVLSPVRQLLLLPPPALPHLRIPGD